MNLLSTLFERRGVRAPESSDARCEASPVEAGHTPLAEAAQEGEECHLAVTFGKDRFHVYLDGQLVSSRDEFTQGIDTNTDNLAINSNTWNRSDDHPYKTYDLFDGQIDEFTIFGSRYGLAEIGTLAGRLSDSQPVI